MPPAQSKSVAANGTMRAVNRKQAGPKAPRVRSRETPAAVGDPNSWTPLTAALVLAGGPAAVKQLQVKLVQWYRNEHRYLPWRAGHVCNSTDTTLLSSNLPSAETAVANLALRGAEARAAAAAIHVTPYAVWVSEVMSQQTQLRTLLPYWVRWMALFPTPAALASADLDSVRDAWAGLGYYRRAAFLHKGAQMVAWTRANVMPNTAAGLAEIPGIGAYTAAAIASTCFNEAVPAVDGNVLRVMTRLGCRRQVDVKSPAVVRAIRNDAVQLIQGAAHPGDFNQALMELGATVCVPQGRPLCTRCPLKEFCAAYAASQNGTLPDIEGVVPLTSKAVAKREWQCIAVAFVWCDVPTGLSEVLVVKRPDDGGLLSGMWELPLRDEESLDVDAVALIARAFGLPAVQVEACRKRVKHIFSHIRHESALCVVRVRDKSDAASAFFNSIPSTSKVRPTVRWEPLSGPSTGRSALLVKHLSVVSSHLAS
jgi:A/G-specific adenine glycosylase